MAEWDVPRREDRYRFQVPVTLHVGRKRIDVLTEDVSFSGMFLRTDTALPLRALIRLEVDVGDPEPLAMTAMVVHTIPPDHPSGRVPGAGIKLYGVGSKARDRWTRHLTELREKNPNARAKRVQAVPAPTREPIARRHARYKAVLAVRAKTVDDLVTTYTRDISQGGAFLQTDSDLRADDTIHVELIHPETKEVFGLDGVVKRTTRDGVGVEFVDLDAARRESFWAFIEPVIELGDDDIELIE